MSGIETLKSTGTVTVCLSPVRTFRLNSISKNASADSVVEWGDSSPLVLPSIRFRDVVLEVVMLATSVS